VSRPLVFLTATEPSGDLMGAGLMEALRRLTADQVQFAGIGGERMTAQGLDSLFPVGELAIMGVAELLPRARQLLRRVKQTTDAALACDPDLIVTIDSWAFSSRIATRLKGRRRCPLIQFVAPKVWAWRPGRARKLARLVDHLLVQLPFEPAFFEQYGLASTFVGHPIIEQGADRGDGARFRRAHGIAEDAPLLTVLPGSRRSEIQRLLPIFAAAIDRLCAADPELRLAVPTVGTVGDAVRDAVAAWPGRPVVTVSDQDKYDAFAASRAALAASGTVALELALAGVPAIITYRLNPLSAWLARPLIRVKYANLVNIILDRPVVPELLQGDCTPAGIETAVQRLLTDAGARDAQRREIRKVAADLGLGDTQPSERAARAALRLLGGNAPVPSAGS
jgi:lipid-A-disaccharide synthase